MSHRTPGFLQGKRICKTEEPAVTVGQVISNQQKTRVINSIFSYISGLWLNIR
jgi:hypothetical protein